MGVKLSRSTKLSLEVRRKLESKGWKIGDVDDFLNLNPDELAVVDEKVKRALKIDKQKQL